MTQHQKAFTYVGNTLTPIKLDYLILAIGLLGGFISIYGAYQINPTPYYVVGSLLLLAVSVLYKLPFYSALELVLFAGHSTLLLDIGTILSFALPSLLCLQLVVYYIFNKQLHNIFTFTGLLGIILLTLGFVFDNPWIYIFGNASIVIFSVYNMKKNPVSLLWATLNSLFLIRIVSTFLI